MQALKEYHFGPAAETGPPGRGGVRVTTCWDWESRGERGSMHDCISDLTRWHFQWALRQTQADMPDQERHCGSRQLKTDPQGARSTRSKTSGAPCRRPTRQASCLVSRRVGAQGQDETTRAHAGGQCRTTYSPDSVMIARVMPLSQRGAVEVQWRFSCCPSPFPRPRS